MGRHFTVGTPVVITFNSHDACIVDDMRQYNGMSTFITKICNKTLVYGKSYGSYYELLGAVSSKGKIPYSFTKDMFIVDEDDEYYD